MLILGSNYDPDPSFDDDSDDPRPWTHAVQVTATLVHILAILATIFRLLYRKHLSRFSWEDTWATLALITDFGCLASVWMQTSPTTSNGLSSVNRTSNWLLSLTITSVLWFARMSILSSVVRIANPTRKLRVVAYCIGAMFLAMDAGLLAQKIYICKTDLCRVTPPVAIAQLVTDVISDTILVIAPIRFLRDLKLSRDRRILVISAFSASLLITGVTILHSVLLFQEATNTTIIIGHVKAALALFVCNALVLVMFAYRFFQKTTFEPELFTTQGSAVNSNAVQFTSVIELPSKLSSGVVMSAIHSKGDVVCANPSTPNTPDPCHSGKAAAPKGAEDPMREYQVTAGGRS